jgi:hypothetical protein
MMQTNRARAYAGDMLLTVAQVYLIIRLFISQNNSLVSMDRNYWASAYSPNNSKFYTIINNGSDTTRLIQYDLNAHGRSSIR